MTDGPKRLSAYFSIEIAVEAGSSIYAGEVGALAADILRSAADIGVSIAGVTMCVPI